MQQDIDFDINKLMEVLADKSISFLSDELGIEVLSKQIYLKDVPKINLNYLTSLTTMEGHINTLFAFSYESELIDKIVSQYCGDIEIDEDEMDIYMQESAAEMINIIIGNATRDFEKKDSLLTFSPPIVVTEAKSLIKSKNAKFFNANIITDFGKMDIYCVTPKDAIKIK